MKTIFKILDNNQIESHRFYGQVRMDVERTLKRFPPSRKKKLLKEFFIYLFIFLLLKIILIRIELNYKKNLLLLLLKF
jgi:hypothetical protein